MGQLANLDWSNVVAAGGSVLAALQHPPPGPLMNFYNNMNYRYVEASTILPQDFWPWRHRKVSMRLRPTLVASANEHVWLRLNGPKPGHGTYVAEGFEN